MTHKCVCGISIPKKRKYCENCARRRKAEYRQRAMKKKRTVTSGELRKAIGSRSLVLVHDPCADPLAEGMRFDHFAWNAMIAARAFVDGTVLKEAETGRMFTLEMR